MLFVVSPHNLLVILEPPFVRSTVPTREREALFHGWENFFPFALPEKEPGFKFPNFFAIGPEPEKHTLRTKKIARSRVREK